MKLCLRNILLLSAILQSVGSALCQDVVSVKTAAGKGLNLIQASGPVYIQERDCFSCHHQAVPMMAANLARGRGLKVNWDATRKQGQFTHEYFKERAADIRQGQKMPGAAVMAGYALVSLQAVEWPADDTTDAIVEYLIKDQQTNGHWKFRTARPPSESSLFAATALSVRGLQAYGTAARKAEIEKRVTSAREWLQRSTPESTEDKTFHLLGLKWADAPEADIKEATKLLLADQRSDGGWAQLRDMEPDAYATAQVLVALRQAGGVAATDTRWRKGLAYLLSSQGEDGSWKVATRSPPIQKYFESGFPHGTNQFISITASAWATMALTLALPEE